MNRNSKLLGLTAALLTAVALPALAAYSLTDMPRLSASAEGHRPAGDGVFTLVDDDGHHASHHERHGEDDDDDDDNGGVRTMPAPAMNAEPPANGLFNKGSTKPQVQVN
jgi:hypothetical protein